MHKYPVIFVIEVADQIVKKTKEIMARVDSMFTQNIEKVLEINAADGHKRDIQGCKINEVGKIKKGSEGLDNREMLKMKRNMPNELNKIPACIKKTRKGTMPDAHNFTQMIGVDVKLGDDEATVKE
ncbi:Protein of unknown function [Gryllus bimaculatus]|nr:Protein of unknown function [Gryllus bimaculatus]